MDVYTTEKEQIEQLKKWLKTYAPAVIIGIAIALAVTFGWRYWQKHKIQQAQSASVLFVNMMGAAMQKVDSESGQLAQHLVKQYPGTIYANFANLLLAKQAVSKQQYATAETILSNVMSNGNNSSIKQVARIRLAKVFVADNKAQQAIDTLKTIDNKQYLGMIDEVRGDAYIALKQPAQAKKAYQAARLALPSSAAQIVAMKLANIA